MSTFSGEFHIVSCVNNRVDTRINGFKIWHESESFSAERLGSATGYWLRHMEIKTQVQISTEGRVQSG